MNFSFRVPCVILLFSGVLLEVCITLAVCFVISVTEGLTSNENKSVANATTSHGSLLPSFSQPFVIKNRFPGNARLTARSGQFKSWFRSLDKKCFSSRLAPLCDLELLGRSFSTGNEFPRVTAFFGSSSGFRHEDTSVLSEDAVRLSLSPHDAQGMLSVSETTTTSCFSEPCAEVGSSDVLNLLLYIGRKKTHPLQEASEICFNDLTAVSKHIAMVVVDSCQRSRRDDDHLHSLGGGTLLVCPAVWEASKAAADYIRPLYFSRRQKRAAKHNDAIEFQMLHSSHLGLKLPGAPPRRLSATEEEHVFPRAQLIPATDDGIGNCKADRGTSCGRIEAQGLFVDPPILVVGEKNVFLIHDVPMIPGDA
ncbi:UNVERIFIED_CONTAM: transmembrane protein, putative [Hammondia hammondi]|eukprot:XP_008889308.1 transmembrane protein, putative [Hammondia hammondi]